MKKTKEHVKMFKKCIAALCAEFDLSLDVLMQHDDGYIEIQDYHEALIQEWMKVEYVGKDAYPEDGEVLQNFKEAIKVVCKQYNLSISHEDMSGGALEIEEFHPILMERFMEAELVVEGGKEEVVNGDKK